MKPLSIDRSALVVIDVQKGFDNLEKAGMRRNNPDAVTQISRLLAVFRSKMYLFKNGRTLLATAGVIALAGLALGLHAQKNQSTTPADDTDTGVPVVIEGLVRDVACPMQNHRSNATNFNLKCALACAKSGSPLIILTRTNEIYFPMSDVMPDPSQREKLMPLVGKFVRVTGTVYRRNGTRTIVIREMVELNEVKLNTTVGDD